MKQNSPSLPTSFLTLQDNHELLTGGVLAIRLCTHWHPLCHKRVYFQILESRLIRGQEQRPYLLRDAAGGLQTCNGSRFPSDISMEAIAVS